MVILKFLTVPNLITTGLPQVWVVFGLLVQAGRLPWEKMGLGRYLNNPFLFVFQSFSPFLHSKWCRKKVVKWGFLTLRKIRVNGLPFDIYISFSFYWCALDQQVTRKTLSNFSWTDFLFVSHCLWLLTRYLGLSGPGVVSSHVTPDIVTSWHWPPRVMMGMTP